MAIEVVTPEEPVIFLDGTKYFADTDTLHVVGDQGNIAVFAPQQWLYARVVSERELRRDAASRLLVRRDA